MAQTYGLALIPWSPLAGGFLTGKYHRDGSRPASARFQPENEDHDLFSDAAFDVLDVVSEIAKEKPCTPSQLALAWCAQQLGVTSPIIGPRTMTQLEDNLGAMHVRVTDEDRARLDEVSPPSRCIASYYEADFGPHTFQW
jgi:aryl-alcohol dehydrogenase-like predicted oxidoreductase